MRLIDADALIRDMEENPPSYGDMDRVIAAVDNAPTIGGWISVKDDMPKEHSSIFAPWYGGSRWTKAMWRKESDNVLLAYKTPDTGAYVIKEGRTHDGKFYSRNITLDNNCEVTHWMEMPTPPSEMKIQKERLYAELSEKYGEKGVDKDWFLTMDGSVHVNSKEGTP